jgi:uncharacterized membrane protein
VGSSAVINYAGGGVMVLLLIMCDIVLHQQIYLPGAETVLNGRAISLVSSVMVNTIINVPVN